MSVMSALPSARVTARALWICQSNRTFFKIFVTASLLYTCIFIKPDRCNVLLRVLMPTNSNWYRSKQPSFIFRPQSSLWLSHGCVSAERMNPASRNEMKGNRNDKRNIGNSDLKFFFTFIVFGSTALNLRFTRRTINSPKISSVKTAQL